MKNVSIRTKILAGVALVILLGALVVVVYLHQSYSSGLDVAAQHAVGGSSSVWRVMAGGDSAWSPGMDQGTIDAVEDMGEAVSAHYGLLLLKDELDQETYEEQREELGLPGNWDERENYVLVATSTDAQMDGITFETPPTEIPGIGKVVGIENGACSETCHGGIAGKEGDFWYVDWSDDSRSRSHAVFPVEGGDGVLVGVMYVIEDISPQADAARESMTRTLFVIALTLVGSALLISWLLDMLVFKRLGRMIVTIEEASLTVAGGGGDVDFKPGELNDEIGQFEKFFAQFLELTSSVFKMLHQR